MVHSPGCRYLDIRKYVVADATSILSSASNIVASSV